LDGILKTKQMITEKLNEAWNVVLGDGGQFDISLRHINQQISGFKDQVAGFFQDLKTAFGGRSIGGEQKAAEKGKNPAEGGSKGNWMQSKVQLNLGPRDASPQTSSRAPRAAPLIEIPLFEIPTDLAKEATDLLETLKNKMANNGALAKIGKNFAPGTGVDFFTAGIEAMIDAVSGGVDFALDVIESIVTSLFKIIKRLLIAVRDFGAKPITIPFVSNLYKMLTSAGGRAPEELTVANLAALLVAVPGSLLKVLTPSEPKARAAAGGAGALWFGLAAGIAKFCVVAPMMGVTEMMGATQVLALDTEVRGLLAIIGLHLRVLDGGSDFFETLLNPDQLCVAGIFWSLGMAATVCDLLGVVFRSHPFAAGAGFVWSLGMVAVLALLRRLAGCEVAKRLICHGRASKVFTTWGKGGWLRGR
jgi:hypothetical protein